MARDAGGPEPGVPRIAGISSDPTGDIFATYDSTTWYSGQQQSVAEVASNGT
jgi:hypothetical protein